MSVIEEDLRLSFDDQDETPFGALPQGSWSRGTPVGLLPERNSSVFADDIFENQTPVTIVLASYGSGKSSALMSEFFALPGFNQRDVPHSRWARMLRVATGWSWREEETPAHPVASVRTRYQMLLRKLHEASGARKSENAGIRAVSDLAEWLLITQGEAILLAGLSQRTFYHWQANPTVQPRLRSVEQLSRLHAFVEGLVHDFGVEWTRAWMKSGTPSRLERLRAGGDALRQIEDEALDAMRMRAVRAVVSDRQRWTDHDRDDAEEFASAEVRTRDPLQSLFFVRDRGHHE